LDYSRFNYLDNIEDDASKAVAKNAEPIQQANPIEHGGDDEGRSNDADMPDIKDLLRNMPRELQQAYHIMSIAKETGDEEGMKRANELALKAVEYGGPEVKKNFISNLSAQAPALGERLGEELGRVTDDPTLTAAQIVENVMKPSPKPEVFEDKVAGLKETMEASAESARVQLENLQKQQDMLESLKSPEDLMKFMHEGGLGQEDLQRMFSGDTAHMEKCFKGMLDKTAQPDPNACDLSKADAAVKAAESLHDNIVGTKKADTADRLDGPTKTGLTGDGYGAVRTPAPVTPAPPVREVKIPDYRLQYQKDDNGKYVSVELRCTLPGVTDMSVILLDVSTEHLRLSTREPAPGYIVNAGPFPVPINADAARAKYSKRREELLITVPAQTAV
jgi:hypothetical protein